MESEVEYDAFVEQQLDLEIQKEPLWLSLS